MERSALNIGGRVLVLDLVRVSRWGRVLRLVALVLGRWGRVSNVIRPRTQSMGVNVAARPRTLSMGASVVARLRTQSMGASLILRPHVLPRNNLGSIWEQGVRIIARVYLGLRQGPDLTVTFLPRVKVSSLVMFTTFARSASTAWMVSQLERGLARCPSLRLSHIFSRRARVISVM